MKQVYVFYHDPTNSISIEYLTNNLRYVFYGYVEFTNFFLTESDDLEQLCADAYLITADEILPVLRKHVDADAKIVKMNRTPGSASLARLNDIPSGADVLVVNDTLENTMQTVYALYEPVFGNLNLIPYDPDPEKADTYRRIEYAVTPGEAHMVPDYIPHVIDIGCREVSFSTMLQLMYVLELDIEPINRNLFRHLHSVVATDASLPDNYVGGYLKGQMLQHMADNSSTSILLTDINYQLIYANKQAEELFSAHMGPFTDLFLYLDKSLVTSSSISSQQISLDGQSYMYNKYVLTSIDEPVGYYFTLETAEDLSNQRSSLKKRGFLARYQFADLVVESAAMKNVLDMAKKIALTDYTVLIQGESGTGKELVAQSIHNYSHRRSKPFVAINCASLADSLLESELFGYEEGSFTGARKKGRPGLFEQANHGTLFLDEIGDISPKLQSELLRVLQEKQIMHVGGDKIIDIDVRIFATTNKDLEQAVRHGTFRSDLFYRLCVIPIVLPPLRERREDIIPLLTHFIGDAVHQIPQSDLMRLAAYQWPGNVRELENVALYYKSFSTFPDYLQKNLKELQGPPLVNAAVGKPDLTYQILTLISVSTAPAHGIGRNELLHQLRERGFAVSDGKLRKLLGGLRDEGLISISRGRGGAMITKRGQDRLDNLDTVEELSGSVHA